MPIRNILKKVIVNLTVSLTAITVFFGSAELISRIKYTPKKINYKWIFEYDKEKLYRLKKNHTGSFAGYEVITNSHGHRDSEIPVQKPPKTIRLLVIGDSITFGHGVDGNQTYTEYLEDLLNNRSKEYHFDVINTSFAGEFPFPGILWPPTRA